jgi:hypothetical protein
MMISIWKANSDGMPIEYLPIMDYDEARIWFLDEGLVADSEEYPDEACPFYDDTEMEEELIAISNGSVTHRSYELVFPDGEEITLHIEGV